MAAQYFLCLRLPAHRTMALLSPESLEARRINLTRLLRRSFPEDFHAQFQVRREPVPLISLTKKASGARMGKGKGPLRGKRVVGTPKWHPPLFWIRLPPTRERRQRIHLCRRYRAKKLGVPMTVRAL
uniref:Ribosomal protein L16 n=1 Tax=Marsupiomonas sp. NIES 1824 TaxID=1562198 RepID=A0A6H0QZS1_9CHLO|nr:ribosomal protein L16 [Marsupiomonas sp. NIES 1824]